MTPPKPLQAVLEAASNALGQLIIGCERAQVPAEQPGRANAKVGCLADLSAQDLGAVAVALRPGASLNLAHFDCARCPRGDGIDVDAVRTRAQGYAVALSTGVTVTTEVTPITSVSRREVFSTWLPTFQNGQGDQQFSRRAIMEVCEPPVSAPVDRPVATSGCTGCWTCVSACPTEALSVLRKTNGVDLVVAVDQCTACGLCVTSCPEDVLSLAAPEVAPRRRAVTIPVGSMTQRVTGHATVRCSLCQRVLSPGETGTCTSCHSHSAILDDVLSQL